MLVLTRRVDESIAIGDTVLVTVLAIEGDRVKLGISAPRDITILRKEIFEAVQAQNLLQEKLAEQPEPSTFDELRQLLAEDAEESEPGAAAPDEEEKED